MSGRCTVPEEVMHESYWFGQNTLLPSPSIWWMELTTSLPTDETPGVSWGMGRTMIRNSLTKFWKNRPRTNRSGIWTPRSTEQKVIMGYELYDQSEGGNRRLWGKFLDPITEEPIISFIVPAGKGVSFRVDRFRIYWD